MANTAIENPFAPQQSQMDSWIHDTIAPKPYCSIDGLSFYTPSVWAKGEKIHVVVWPFTTVLAFVPIYKNPKGKHRIFIPMVVSSAWAALSLWYSVHKMPTFHDLSMIISNPLGHFWSGGLRLSAAYLSTQLPFLLTDSSKYFEAVIRSQERTCTSK